MIPAGFLKGKTALITGAGGGMGSACARAYSNAGASVVLIDLDSEKLAQTAAEVETAGAKALALAIDITDAEMIRAAIAQAEARFSQIDILVNCAGMQGPGAPVWQVEPSLWRKTVEVNLYGTFLMCRFVLPGMIARRSGKVINVASGAGVSPMPFFSGYAAGKAAVIHFTRTIANELAPYGINANAVGVRGVTKMWRDVLEAGEGGGTTTAAIRAQYEAGFQPKIEENMSLFLFLASDEARHITGQYIEANDLPACLIR